MRNSSISIITRQLLKVALPALLLSERTFANLTFLDSWTNQRFLQDFPTRVPGTRIYGIIGRVAVTKFLTDPAPPANNATPSAIVVDGADNRLVWRYYDPKAFAFGFHGYDGSADGISFSAPSGIAARSSGEIYVSDTGHDRIVKLSYNANTITFVSAFGSKGTSPGQFDLPQEVSLDRFGNVFVADGLNNRVQKFNPNGTPMNDFIRSSVVLPQVPTNEIGRFGIDDGLSVPGSIVQLN